MLYLDSKNAARTGLEARAPATRLSMDLPAPAPPLESDSVLSCFLVEDSPLIRDNLTATLEEMAGARVLGWAEDQQSAEQWLQAGHACDLMIIDLFLKGGTGFEVLRLAKLERPDLKLVVLTNYATVEIRHRCLLIGADRVFDKSAEIEELLAYCDTVQRKQTRDLP